MFCLWETVSEILSSSHSPCKISYSRDCMTIFIGLWYITVHCMSFMMYTTLYWVNSCMKCAFASGHFFQWIPAIGFDQTHRSLEHCVVSGPELTYLLTIINGCSYWSLASAKMHRHKSLTWHCASVNSQGCDESCLLFNCIWYTNTLTLYHQLIRTQSDNHCLIQD